jgi:hypothetical protein
MMTQADEIPFDCPICRMEMADRLLDSVDGDITSSIIAFVTALNPLAIATNANVMFVIAQIMKELHEEHSEA